MQGRYGLVPFISKNEQSEIQNQPCNKMHYFEEIKVGATGSAVVSIRILPLFQMPSAAWYGLFSPPAFQDNYFNVDPEIHFAFFKNGGNL